ncbi:guanine nucleotide-binding protein subunit beta-like protein 1, partial [Dinothrombium tinctorium]
LNDSMITALKLFEDNSVAHLIVGNESGFLLLYRIEVNTNCLMTTRLHQLKVFDEMVTSIDFDSKKKVGICGSPLDSLITVNLVEKEKSLELNVKHSISITNPGISSIAIRSDGKIVATGGWDSRIRVFSWKSLKPLAVLIYHKNTVECVAFSPKLVENGKYLLAAASSDHTATLWDIYN